MAIPMSLVPCLSFDTISSSASCSSSLSSFSFQSLCPFKPHCHGLKLETPTTNGSLVVHCSAREMGSGSNPLNGSMKRQISSMAPSGMTPNEASITMPSYKWRRVLLKVSGEALAGDRQQNIDPKVTMAIAREVAAVTRLGIEVAIVVGGGNIFRGSSWAGSSGLDRSSADCIGMLATVMNAIFLQATMESIGIPTRVQTAFRMSEVAEPYIRRRAVRHLEKGRVVIFAAGTGNPFFTTDTAAALRCAEINAQVLLKATNVDGVFDDDPRLNRNARLLETLTYQEVTSKDLSVMDMTAVTLCQENNIPVVVFNLTKPDNISKAIKGERVGTLIGGTRNSMVKEIRRLADNMVQFGKEGSLCAARRAAAFVRGDDVLHKLFTELAYRYKDRAGGYTRLLRTRIRVGDAAPMAYIEFIDRENELRQSKPPNPQPPQKAPLDPWTRSRLNKQFASPKEIKSDSEI